MQCKRCVSCSG
uniref:Uncharacterized protein n=1 Tax=Anguilla anguilla TaxID=7936 RepID=A0A0E9QET8_ANGAN